MAKLLDVIQGLGQAAANSYDGALDEDGKPIELGLKREDTWLTDLRLDSQESRWS